MRDTSLFDSFSREEKVAWLSAIEAARRLPDVAALHMRIVTRLRLLG